MQLTEYNLCYYLLDKGMIDLPTLVSGNFTARRNDSRNNNFIINKEHQNNKLFIKQVRAPDTEKIESLRAEAACYQLASTNPQYKLLKSFLPSFFHYDPQNHILIIEQIKDAFSVHDFYFGFYNFQNNLPQLLADVLASYQTNLNSPTLPHLPFSRRQKPWVFSLVSAGRGAWPGGPKSVEQQILQLIFKNKEFVQLLSRLENEWQAESLVHNDVKFSNFLMNYEPEKKGIKAIKLIDWELADVGDPLWDAASVLQNFLFLWVSTDVPEQEYSGSGLRKITLDEVQPCLQMFWQRYIQQRKILANQSLVLRKAIQFTALKLIHSCFEMAPASPVLQPLTVKILQLSFNILRSPAEAAGRLFGLK